MHRILLGLTLGSILSIAGDPAPAVRAVRRPENPIVTEAMLPGDDGASINGPSLIAVPKWVRKPLGRYYLYFAHHAGKYIRMAYADQPQGPWKMHAPGVLNLTDQRAVRGHVASPEVVVDEAGRRVYLFYHGKSGAIPSASDEPEPGQQSAVAVSTDGVTFRPLNRIVGPSYLRVFQYRKTWYGLTGRGALLKAASLESRFQPVGQLIGDDIPTLLDPVRLGEPGAKSDRPLTGPDRYSIRHSGVDVVGDRLAIYFTCVGHRPERIFVTFVDLKGAPETWRARGATEVLRPVEAWEGVRLPLEFSKGGRSRAWENGIRDPAVFRENGKAWLLYSTAGEHGLGIADLYYGGVQ
jgi:hypothetical protein